MDSKCKICRRQGEKLFLKGARCYTPKCAMVRKPYAPGIHGNKKRRRTGSEFGAQLTEKQKVRFLYGVSESQFEKYVRHALETHGGDVVQQLIRQLEFRLDNVVFRLGFAVSRSLARQMISHGHITVDGKKVFIASYHVRVGTKIGIAPASLSKGLFRDVDITLKKQQVPSWLTLEPEKHEGEVISLPKVEDVVRLYNIKSIIEYYSR